MQKRTEEVRKYLESKGFTRENGEPFADIAYFESNGNFLLMHEEHYWQDVRFLIEDALQEGATEIAQALTDWIK